MELTWVRLFAPSQKPFHDQITIYSIRSFGSIFWEPYLNSVIQKHALLNSSNHCQTLGITIPSPNTSAGCHAPVKPAMECRKSDCKSVHPISFSCLQLLCACLDFALTSWCMPPVSWFTLSCHSRLCREGGAFWRSWLGQDHGECNTVTVAVAEGI